MCGRFTLRTPASELAGQLHLFLADEFAPRYNIAPGQTTALVRRFAPPTGTGLRASAGAGGAAPCGELVAARWGLIPHWARDESIAQHTINARCETAPQKPAFRQAWARQRGAVPADGFFEWQKRGREKQPFLISRTDGQVLLLAGLWDTWSSPGGGLLTFTILTTPANATLRPLHERMPAVLRSPGQLEAWLADAPLDEALWHEICQPAPDAWWQLVPVSTAVNRVACDDARCIEPVDLPSAEEPPASERPAPAARRSPRRRAKPEDPQQGRLF